MNDGVNKQMLQLRRFILGSMSVLAAVLFNAMSFTSLNAQIISITYEVDTAFYAPIPDSGFDPDGLLEGFVTYDIYANFTNPTDELSAIYSDVDVLGTLPLYMDAPCGCFNPMFGDVLLGGQQNPAIIAAFPETEYDSFWTLGFAAGEQFTSTNIPPYTSANMCSTQVNGGLMFTVAPVAAGPDLRIQIAQVTTCGDFSFHACFQVFIEGEQSPYQEWCMEGDGDGPMNIPSPCANFVTGNSEVTTTVPINCYGDLAEVEITASGTAPMTYELFDASDSTLIVSQEENFTFGDLSGGDYFVAIVDDNTCRDSTEVFTFVEPNQLSAMWQVLVDNACPDELISVVQISQQGGTPPFTMEATSAEFPGQVMEPDMNDQWLQLPCSNGIGDWFFELIDGNGCSIDTTLTLNCPEALILDLEATDVSCFDYGDGQVDGSFSGGTGELVLTADPAFSETISGSGLVNFELDNVLPGEYVVTLTDANDCSITETISLIEPAPVLIMYNTSDILCANECSGVVDVVAEGGTGGFSYYVTDLEETEVDADALCAGSFQANAEDENGCIVQAIFTIEEPEEIEFALDITDVTCAGESNGEICFINATGGVGVLEFQIDPPAGPFGDQTCFDVFAGTYIGTVQDENGCSVSAPAVTLVEPEPIQLVLTDTPISCASYADGMLEVNGVGGTGTLSLVVPVNETLPFTLMDLDAGLLEVTVQDENGCEIMSTAEIIEPDSLIVELLFSEDVVCGGDCDGSAIVDFSGGTGDVLFTLNGLETFNFDALCALSYSAVVVDDNGCQDSTLFDILEPEPIEVLMNVTGVTCTGMSDGAVNIFPVGGTGELTWEIEELGLDLSNLYEGVYHVYALDATGCAEDTSFTVGAIEDTDMVLNMLSSPVTCWNEKDGTATASVVGGHQPVLYLWSDELAQETPTATGLYEDVYSVIVTDSLGCTLTSVVEVEPTIGCFFIADALTPNGDGYNDEWIVGGLEFFPLSRVSVFNRWGQELFTSMGYSKRWDGRYNNAPLPMADYYYVIEFSEGQEPITGTVTLKY